VTDFYEDAQKDLQHMRNKNMNTAEVQADLQVEASMAPIEREFTETYWALWSQSCRTTK